MLQDFTYIELNYCLKGDKKNPVLLLLHGFMGNSEDFNSVISLLSQEFCCLTVDLPGHGKTKIYGGEEYYTMPNTAQALIELLDSLKIDQCFLAGYSMGGRLALYMTLEFSSRFQKVILESASPGLKSELARSLRIQADQKLAQQLETTNFKSFLSNWYNQPIFNSLRNHSDFKPLIDYRLNNNPLELAKSLRQMGIGKQSSLWEKLKHNKIPLLLLVGEYDRKFRLINTEMAHICPVAQLKIISHTGHNIHLENMQEWSIQVKQFCQG